MPQEAQLKVAKAYPNDSGRGIARLDPDTLLKLQLSPGEIIEIVGKTSTAAKVWRADRQDWHEGIIRIDGFIRQNAGVGMGERVLVRKPKVNEAQKVVLAPPEGTVAQPLAEMTPSAAQAPNGSGGRRAHYECRVASALAGARSSRAPHRRQYESAGCGIHH
jgi:hypothetical protein